MMDTFQILVFSSNIDAIEKVNQVKAGLLSNSKVYSVHVDLEDWEYVLRVEAHPGLYPNQIEEQINKMGFKCSELLD